MEQELEKSELEQYEKKIERAKKLYVLFNDITFGNEVEATKSRIILRHLA
jgi:hypothetical protein